MTDKQTATRKYSDPGCAYCPTKMASDEVAANWELYKNSETRRIAPKSACIEAEGYCQWTQVEEGVQFSKKMGFTKIGIATCISFVDLANILSQILESHGFGMRRLPARTAVSPRSKLGSPTTKIDAIKIC